MSTKNRENEAGLVGAVLKDPSKLDSLLDIIVPEDFDWRCYGWAWAAMKSLHERGLSVDTITVGDELDRANRLIEFQYAGEEGEMKWEGRGALSRLRDLGTPRAVFTYATNVKDYSAKRQLMNLLNTGADWTLNGRNATQIMKDLTQMMCGIKTFDGGAFEHTKTLSESISDVYDHVDRASRGEIKFVQTGYVDLDKILGGGMSAPDLITIAGRPGGGKTALLGSIAKNAASSGKRVFVFSLEMQNKQIAMRLIAQESGVSYDKQKSGNLQGDEWERFTNAVETLADEEKYPIVLNDLPNISISKIRQELRRIKDVDLVVIDYIQLGGVDGKYDRRDQEIGEITRGLKSIAKEFNIPVLAAAQLSREVEKRGDKRPILSDLRESGSLEQDSDIVAFIHKPDPLSNGTEIIVAKQRNGAVGSVELIYKPTLTRFESATLRIFNPNIMIEA